MVNKFVELEPEMIKESVFKLIGSDWMLISAGTKESFNMMTASWGGFGVLWNNNICFCVIRPTRYTFEFMEKQDRFTLSFFDEEYKKKLNYCGSYSGRHVNKVKETGLTPLFTESQAVYFNEARLVIECEKIYYQDLDPANFLDESIEENYPKKDYHRMYVGKIVRCLTR